jgi:hypothetical protein
MQQRYALIAALRMLFGFETKIEVSEILEVTWNTLYAMFSLQRYYPWESLPRPLGKSPNRILPTDSSTVTDYLQSCDKAKIVSFLGLELNNVKAIMVLLRTVCRCGISGFATCWMHGVCQRIDRHANPNIFQLWFKSLISHFLAMCLENYPSKTRLGDPLIRYIFVISSNQHSHVSKFC